MARRSPVNVGLALALIFVITSNGQADDTCRSGCKGASQTFKLQEGTTYKYNYDSKIEVSLSSAKGEKSITEVKATVLLTQQADCNQVVRLQNVQVIGADGKKHGQIPDVDKPIRINYHDGHLEDSICVTPGDTQNSLNLKRAIASIFQANLKNGHETDVFGLCPTEVNHHKEGNVLVVQKSRNLNRCAYRESIQQDFLATAFNLNSEIKSSPILNGEYSSKLRIKNGILDQAVVHENYLYVPFSVGDNGAKASVDTTLKLAGTSKDNPQARVSQPRSIIFENPHPVNSPKTNVNSILAAVKETAKTIDVTVGEETAKEFANLVRILRVSKKDDLLAVYNQVRAGVGFTDKVAAKKLFLDALLRAGNGDNIEVAIELMKNRELNEIEQRLVYLGLSVVRHPTTGSLDAAVNLLNQPNLPRAGYLGIGTLAGRYCRQHSCKNIDSINKLTQKLIQKLGNGKANNRQEENNIVFTLKALGNIHHLNDAVLSKIIAIAQDKKAPNRLRVTALETYLADPCKDRLRDSALNILKDIQQDSEIRIKAYLAAAQCPNNKVGNVVKALLENEPSYQVGGFIVSHIRNVRASTNPDKELAKQYLGNINVPKRYPFDLRKYSANGEFSYTIDTLGVANSIESNVIYSQKSFLPRSTSMNLTAEVFGHTFNFLEVETRQENLDRLIEHYFGAQGLLRSNSLQELWESKGEHAKNLVNNLRDRIEQTLRSRRDVSKSEIDHIAKQVQVKTNDLNNDLDLDLSVKAFGSEVLFFNINDDVAKYTPEAIIDQIVNGLNTGLDRLKNFEETLRSNLLFLDAEFAYPTSSGFPLRLGVEGSFNAQVKASGSIDLRTLLKQDSTVKISIIPSANVEVAGRLTIDALVLESGLKVVSNLHTSTGGDLIVNLFSTGVDVKFSLPVEKQNLISASHDILFFNREWGGPEIDIPLKFDQNKEFSICMDQLGPFIGLNFCADITGPNVQGEKVPILPFPLSGDAKFAVIIERSDLSQYHYRSETFSTSEKLGAEIILEALDDKHQKKISLDLEAFLIPEKYVKASLTSPAFSASLEGRIISTPNEQSISVRLLQDKNEYMGKVGVGIQGSQQRSIFKPIFQYKTPQTGALQVPPYRVEGQVIVERPRPDQTTYTLDNVRLIIPDQKTISLNGKLGTEPETILADITASDGQNSASFKGKLRVNPRSIKYNAELRNSVNPMVNVHLKGELDHTPEELKNFFQVAHGGDFSDKNNILTIENVWVQRRKSAEDYLITIKNKLTYPALETSLNFDFGLKPAILNYNIDVQYQNVKLGSELDFGYNRKQDGVDFNVNFGVWGLSNRVILKAKRQVSGEQSRIENSLEINGKRIEVNGKIRHRIRPQDVDVGSDLIVKLPTHNNPFNFVNGLKVTANDIDLSYKVTSANVVYVDLFFKANKAGNANGSIKINVKGQLVVNGQIKANKGNGNGEIVIELPSAGRTAKIDTTFTIHEPRYNLVINIYPIFNQDKGKKITFSTQSTINANNVDSKNLVEIFGEKLEANVKGNLQGDEINGKINGEIEIILPTSNYLAGKLHREITTVNNVINGNFVVNLEHRRNKNQAGDKISLKGHAKNTNVQAGIFDVNYQLLAESAGGQNINVDLGVKKNTQGEVQNLEIANKIYGSLLKSPLETTIRATCKSFVEHTLEVRSSYAPVGNAVVTGKYNDGDSNKPYSGDINVEVTSPSEYLRTLKAGISASVLKGDVIDVKGQGKVYADSPKGKLVDIEGSGEVRASDKEGRVKASGRIDKAWNGAIDAGFSITETKDNQQVKGDLDIKYGQNQNIRGDVILTRIPQHEYKLDVKLDTPSERFRNSRLQVHTKRNEEATHYQSEVIATTNGRSWTTTSDFLISNMNPGVDIKIKDPEGKLQQLHIKITKLSEDQLGGQLKIVSQKDNFLLEGSVDANVQSVDNFHIKVTANSPALKIDKVIFDAQNKPAKAGRRIQVTAKSGNKNILAGSTSYSTREEHGKLIVEGSGSFKVKDETKSANFKYIRQNLNQEKNGETGIDISFDATLGNKAVDAELKVTNKQFRILNSYCEEKKQCAHVEIDVRNNVDTPSEFNQVIEVSIDLRKLGLSHEFGLKAVTMRKEWLLDHTVDVHFQNQDTSRYQYSFYVHPKQAGVSLSTPKRIIALESQVNFPENILQEGGRISADAVLYMDKKNHPNQKSGIQAFLNIVRKGNPGFEGEIRFTNPALRRPLLVSVKGQSEVTDQKIRTNSVLVLDIFAQPDQKITITTTEELPGVKYDGSRPFAASEVTEVKSSGLQIDIRIDESAHYSYQQSIYKYASKVKYHVGNSRYNSELSYELTPKNLRVIATLLNVPLLRLNSQLQLSQNQEVIDSEIQCYGHKPLVSHLEIKNHNTVKYFLARKDNPNDKLIVNAGLIPGQIADFRAEVLKGGQTHELGHATVKLDDANFLQSDYNVQSKNIEEYFLKPLKGAIDGESQELQRLSDEALKNSQQELQHLSEITGKAIPDVGPIRQYYVNEMDKIRQEILEDKTIKDVSEFLYNIIGAVAQAFGEVFSNFSAAVENIARSLQESFGKIIEAIQKDILPKVKEISDQLLQLFVNVVNTTTEMVLVLGTKAAEMAEKYRPELQQLATIVGEVGQDVMRAVLEIYQTIYSVVIDQWQQVYKEIQQLPAYEQLKAEYHNLIRNGIIDPAVLAGTIKDMSHTLQDLALIPEVKELIQAVSDYVIDKLTSDKPVDDQAAISRITKAALAVVTKLSSALAGGDVSDLQNVKVPLPTNALNQIPRWSTARFSPLSYFLREDVDIPEEFLKSLVNTPRNWIPPFPLYGLIAQGQHIFTFDGKHITFPGKCNYLLARDAVDGNFTVIGTYNNGLLTAISLTQGSDTITLKKNGQVTINNSPTELPVRKPNIAAYRNIERINLVSSYGIQVICGPQLVVCSVTVSGFYHGKIRGLLGNGNNEPYDDFTIPNGKIVSSESEFGNSYKTSSGCPAVQTVSHEAHHPVPSCQKLFGYDSSLRYCYPFVPVHNFMMACNHGVAANVKETEYAIAIAYVAACNQHAIPVRLPSEFVKCTNGDKPTAPGETFTVKTPGKQADIVLLVDTNKNNEQVYKEYVQPLVQQLTSELHSKGINDVEFHLIAYGGENQWPSHITVSGGKLTFKGKAPNLKFTEAPAPKRLVTGCKNFDFFITFLKSLNYDLKLAFGQDLQALTWTEGIEYPFRANAIKSILVVTGKPCQLGQFYPLQLLRTLLYRDKTINLNVITSINKPKSDAKNIVGFNSRNVFSLPGGKSKVKHFADLGKELEYDDYCIDFTVQNDGNIFISDHILQVPKGQRKQFVQITSHNIVDQFIGVEKGYNCECKYVTPFSAQNVCRLVTAKERPQARKAGTKS